MEHVEVRDVLVPLVEGRHVAGPATRPPEQLPHLGHRVIGVGVEDVRALVRVTGDVVLHDAVGGHVVDVYPRIESVVERADVHVVDVEEQPAVGLLGQAGQEIPLRHRRGGELDV